MNRSPSIRTYLTLSHVLIVTVSLALMGLITSARQQSQITDELAMQMLIRVQALQGLVEQDDDYQVDGDLAVLELPGSDLQADLTVVFVDEQQQIHNLTDSEIAAPVRESILHISREPFDGDSGMTEILHDRGGVSEMYAVARIDSGNPKSRGIICILAPLSPIRAYVNRQRLVFGAMILIVSLLGILSSILLTRPLISRAADVRELASMVIHAGYKVHVPETGPREASEISHYLNEMVDKLDEQEQTRRTILSNVTHELARPLAGLRLGLESLQKGAIERPELADDLLSNMGHAIQQMEMLLDDITLAISPTTRSVKLQQAYISAQPFLQGIASRFWTMADMRGVKIQVKVPQDLPQIFADEQRLTQILGNLVHNAIKFTPRQRTIVLSAEAGEDNTIRLIVWDRGSGISEEDTARLFTPFFQGEHGLRLKQGMGLGLSIALQLARLHGGDLELRNHPDGGAMAILTMPAEAA